MILQILLSTLVAVAAPKKAPTIPSEVSSATLQSMAIAETTPKVTANSKNASEVVVPTESITLALKDPGLNQNTPWLDWGFSFAVNKFSNPFSVATKYQGTLNLEQSPSSPMPSFEIQMKHDWYGITSRYSSARQIFGSSQISSGLFDVGIRLGKQLPQYSNAFAYLKFGTSNLSITNSDRNSDLRNFSESSTLSYIAIEGQYRLAPSILALADFTSYSDNQSSRISLNDSNFILSKIGVAYLW